MCSSVIMSILAGFVLWFDQQLPSKSHKDFYSADYEASDFLVKLFGQLGLWVDQWRARTDVQQIDSSILAIHSRSTRSTRVPMLAVGEKSRRHIQPRDCDDSPVLPVFRLVQAGTTGCPFVILNRHVSCMSGTFTECMFKKVPHCGMCVVSAFGQFDSLLIDKFVQESVLQIQPGNELLRFFPFENPCCIELQNMSFCSLSTALH